MVLPARRRRERVPPRRRRPPAHSLRSAGGGSTSATEPLLHLACAAGFDVGAHLAAVAELTSTTDVLTDRDDDGHDYVTAIDAGLRWDHGRVSVVAHAYAATVVRAAGGGLDVSVAF